MMTLTEPDVGIIRTVVKEEVKDQLTKFRSQTFNRLDKILKVVNDTNQEVTALAAKSRQHTDQIEDLDRRVTRVEKTAALLKS